MCLVCSRCSKESNVAGAEGVIRRVDEVRERRFGEKIGFVGLSSLSQ